MARGQLSTQDKWAAQLLAMGKPLAEVAEEVELPVPTLKRHVELPLFQQEVERWRNKLFSTVADRLVARLERLQEPALERMADLMQAESEPVQFQAAKNLLDRGPLAPRPGNTQGPHGPGSGATIHLDQQALTAILSGALNIGNNGIIAAFAALPAHAPAERIIRSSDLPSEAEG